MPHPLQKSDTTDPGAAGCATELMLPSWLRMAPCPWPLASEVKRSGTAGIASREFVIVNEPIPDNPPGSKRKGEGPGRPMRLLKKEAQYPRPEWSWNRAGEQPRLLEQFQGERRRPAPRHRASPRQMRHWQSDMRRESQANAGIGRRPELYRSKTNCRCAL